MREKWYRICKEAGVARVCCTDILLKTGLPSTRVHLLKLGCKAAGVPSILTEEEYLAMLQGLGFSDVKILILPNVFSGFSKFCERHVESLCKIGMREEGFELPLNDLKSKGAFIGECERYFTYVCVSAKL